MEASHVSAPARERIRSAMRSSSFARPARRLRTACIIVAASLLCGLPLARPAMAAGHQPAGPAGKATAAKARPAHPYQTPGQALAQAQRTRKAVPVTGATTATSTLTANPDGSFTLTESTAPVRARVNGTWRALDARLARNHDGTYSPAVPSHPLTLSGGGTGPLATMTYGAYSLALTAPVRLPAPSVSGSTATYTGILPGVSLIVTAKPSGDYSEVLRVDTPAAAGNPALATLAFATHVKGVALHAAPNGTVTARTPRGQAIFTSPAPRMWDSAVSPSRLRAMAAKGGGHADPAGQAPASALPGDGAHVRRLGVTVSGGRLTLTPDHGLLTGRGAVFPEYIDPDWHTPSPGPSASNWAYVSSDFPVQPYYDGSDYLQVGHNPDTGGTSYAFYQIPVSSQIRGAFIHSATAYFPEVWADSCTPSPVDLYQTGAISPSTTYNNQPSWNASPLGSANVAFGWSTTEIIGGPSSCPIGAQDVSYDVRSVIAADAATTSGPMPALNVGLKAESTASVGWKKFANPRTTIAENATITIQYAHPPATPALSTSPAANCATGATVVGNGNVTLNARVSDPDGGVLGVAFTATANGHTFASNPTMNESAGSGTIAHLPLSMADLDNAVQYGSNSQVLITWTATVSTGLSGVPTSPATCKFTFSTLKPGKPTVTNCDDGTQAYAVGTPALFTVDANTSSGVAAPTSYAFQLNGGNPVPFAAGSTSPYPGHFSVAPTRQYNFVTVIAISATGTIGDTEVCPFSATVPAAAADQDMNGDGIPDLLTVGNGTTGTASGLWLAAGQGSGGRFNGTVATTADDIGPYGPQGMGTAGSSANPGTPADWNGLKAISGQFLGPGFNDIEAFAPGTNQAYILQGQGDGSVATSQGQNFTSVFDDTSAVSGNVNHPQQLVNAYDASGSNQAHPDELAAFTDPSVGSYLGYFQAYAGTGPTSFDQDNSNALPYELSNPTPDGTMDWPSWTITTGSDTRGGTSYTDMYLRNQSTGALYLWELTGLTNKAPGGFDFVTFTNTNPTATLTYTPTQLSANWKANASLASLQATDIGGSPGLMDVTSAGQVEAWSWDGTSLKQANVTGASQKLLTADHTYLLDDVTDDGTPVTTAADQPGAGKTQYDLSQNTGVTGAQWNSGDPLFSPDVQLNGTTGFLTSSSQSGDFTPSSSFSVSAWVNLAVLGGTVFSQNGSSYSTVKVSATTSGQWQVAVNTSGSAYVTATGGTVRTGVWTNLTLTYDSGAGILKLYASGTEVAYMQATPLSQTGKFLLGASQVAGNAASFLNGQVATTQVWDSLAVPVQPPAPASALIAVTPTRLLDTRTSTTIPGPVAAGATISVPVRGAALADGGTIPTTGVTAAAISVTVVGAATGYLTAFPDAAPRPATSTLNCDPAGDTLTNDAIVPVGGDGKIAIYNGCGGGATQILVDITGYFTSTTTATGASTYTPLADPVRLFYTGNGTGLPNSNPVPANSALTVTIEGDNTNGAGIPATGVTAIALNIGAIAPSGDNGFIEAYPNTLATRPAESNISFTGGETYQDTVIVPVGSDGKVKFYNGSAQPIDLVGDLSGYFTTATTGKYYHALDGTRITDTRQTTSIAANATRNIADPVSVVADDPALVVNVTITSPASPGYLKVWPGDQLAPGTSIVTFATSQTIASLALVSTTNQNSFNIANASAGITDVILDTDGYFQ
jgi:hypothetical protein